jgi:hypothetical protein
LLKQTVIENKEFTRLLKLKLAFQAADVSLNWCNFYEDKPIIVPILA